MSKIALDEVEAKMLEHKIDANKVQEVLRDLEAVVEELKAERSSDPKLKWEYLIVLHDPENKLAGQELTGWVVQQEEGQDAGTVLSKITDASKTSNDNAKKKKFVIKTLVDAFKYLKPKWVKEKKLKLKTKEEVRVLLSNGNLV